MPVAVADFDLGPAISLNDAELGATDDRLAIIRLLTNVSTSYDFLAVQALPFSGLDHPCA